MTETVDIMLKIVVVGDCAVGKTSLIMRYTEDKFSDEPVTTIGPGVDFKRKEIVIENKKIELQLWDTAGQERFRSITDTFYKGAHGILLVFDVTDTESFGHINNWARDLDRYLYDRPDTVKFLIGNKIDEKQQRRISYENAKDAAEKQFEMCYEETSAKENTNVDEMMERLVREILGAGLAGNFFEEQQKRNAIPIRITNPVDKPKKKCCQSS